MSCTVTWAGVFGREAGGARRPGPLSPSCSRLWEGVLRCLRSVLAVEKYLKLFLKSDRYSVTRVPSGLLRDYVIEYAAPKTLDEMV